MRPRARRARHTRPAARPALAQQRQVVLVDGAALGVAHGLQVRLALEANAVLEKVAGSS